MAVPAGAKKPSDRKPTAAQRRKAEQGGVYRSVELNGYDIRFTHPKSWRASAMDLLNAGNMNGWASKVVHPEDVAKFKEADPNGGELGEAIANVHTLFGAEEGE